MCNQVLFAAGKHAERNRNERKKQRGTERNRKEHKGTGRNQQKDRELYLLFPD